MNTVEMYEVNRIVEYIKHLVDCGESFPWEQEDIENDIQAVIGFYNMVIDDLSCEGVEMLKSELIEIAEQEQEREIARIYAIA